MADPRHPSKWAEGFAAGWKACQLTAQAELERRGRLVVAAAHVQGSEGKAISGGAILGAAEVVGKLEMVDPEVPW